MALCPHDSTALSIVFNKRSCATAKGDTVVVYDCRTTNVSTLGFVISRGYEGDRGVLVERKEEVEGEGLWSWMGRSKCVWRWGIPKGLRKGIAFFNLYADSYFRLLVCLQSRRISMIRLRLG